MNRKKDRIKDKPKPGCPNCGSDNTKEVRTLTQESKGGAVQKAYYCQECFHECLPNGTLLQPLI